MPTRKHEAWRYTNLKSVENSVFEIAPATELEHSKHPWDELDAYKLSLVDRVLNSKETQLPEGVKVLSLKGGELAAGVLGQLAHRDDAMTALNGAFLNSGNRDSCVARLCC